MNTNPKLSEHPLVSALEEGTDRYARLVLQLLACARDKPSSITVNIKSNLGHDLTFHYSNQGDQHVING